MQSERKRILTMLEDGIITTEDALTLLEKLGKSQPTSDKETTGQKAEESTTPNDEFDTKDTKSNGEQSEEPSMEDFLDDLKKDFSHVGDRFMQFMQSAVQKVKTFDFETPFGHAFSFNHTISKTADGIEEVLVDIDNGKVTIHCGEENEVRADFTVKTYSSESEEIAKNEFLDKILVVKDENKLMVSSNMKMTQVNLNLYIPKKNYDKISARLLNGSFKMNDVEANKVRVKTANGKIGISNLTFKEAEFETVNGSIDLNGLIGTTLEAETLNGRVYIDGLLKNVEAQSLSGHVVVTTTDSNAERIEAKTMSGSVEIYIPSDISLSGEIASNMGRLDLQLGDVNRTKESEQLFQRSIRFKKEIDNEKSLHIFGEAKTGSVLVCYNAKHL
ncbi:DUF4097 family beta strand repeat-containing protein [Sporosarcina sp. FA9]|uniref:DUF4097 family beta strand repeat-containing protein n=1 Tax=Sporosarcina sp. FA9 TaxID=3413030 RepID=UPI003F656183